MPICVIRFSSCLLSTLSKNSVYYRMRHEWGMKQVLDSCTEDSEADRMKVEEMATMVSPDFLQKIGYRLNG